MLGVITSWLFISASKKETIKREIDILGAIDSHIHWKVRLLSYRNGLSEEVLDPADVCRDDLCNLGKWIHGAAKRDFIEFDEFLEMQEKHAYFHAVAGKVVQHVQEQNYVSADKLLNNEYSQASREVVRTLIEFAQRLQ
jgi:hypothetical protein